MNAMSLNRVERSFSRCFDSYREHASQQAWIARHLIARMDELSAPNGFGRVFEFGCGTGLLTEALLERFDIQALTLNDLTPTAARTADATGAAFLPGDVRGVVWPQNQDLVASASTIQWIEDPTALLRRATAALRPGGWLVVSGFGPDQYRELPVVSSAERAPGLHPSATLAAAVATDPSMTVLDVAETIRQLWFDTPTDVLRHLRRTGVNGTKSRSWTRTDLARFSHVYQEKFGTDQGVSLTYHPTWVIARKSG